MGKVYFVGGGPGDPGMLTVRGAELLDRAAVVAFDAELDARLVRRIPAQAERIAVAPGADAARTAELLVRAARMRDVVVRLGHGDSFGFGAAAPEALAVQRAGVQFEVVPGVPMPGAATALAGVPLAAGGPGDVVVSVRRGPGGETLVIESTAARLEAAAAEAVARGCAGTAPALVVSGAGSPRQRTRSGPLLEVVAATASEHREDPVILVAGAAAAVRGVLPWFESRPLFGWTVVVTRPRSQAADLIRMLEEHGASVREVPMIRTEPPRDPGPLRAAARSVGTFDWVAFTSANGVERFWMELAFQGLDARAFGAARVACTGPATAAMLSRHGVRPDLVPEAYVAEALLEALVRTGDLAGARVLLPRAAAGRAVLPDGLRAHGAEVVDIEAYRTVPETAAALELRGWLQGGVVDVLTFTSPSTVDSFVDSVGTDTGRALVAAIGPITAARAAERGLPLHVEAEEHTAAGLVEALVASAPEERRGRRRV